MRRPLVYPSVNMSFNPWFIRQYSLGLGTVYSIGLSVSKPTVYPLVNPMSLSGHTLNLVKPWVDLEVLPWVNSWFIHRYSLDLRSTYSIGLPIVNPWSTYWTDGKACFEMGLHVFYWLTLGIPCRLTQMRFLVYLGKLKIRLFFTYVYHGKLKTRFGFTMVN